MTLERYLAFEDASSRKHEYVDGEIYAMSGVTRRHSRIAGNVFAAARVAAVARGCRAHIADVKLVTDRAAYYPDVMVACGPEPSDPRIEDAPCLVVEVLSPSTAAIDRREKRVAYQRIGSVQAYLIVDPERRVVDWYARGDDGAWMHATLVERGEIELACPPLTLTLDAIYEGVELPPADARRMREDEEVYG